MKKITNLVILIILISCLTTESKKEEIIIESKIDKNLAFLLLCACIQTYNSYEGIQPQIFSGYKEPIVFSGKVLGKTEKLGLIYQSQDNTNIIIAFRGSKSIKDWIADFEFWQTDKYQTKYVNVNDLLVEDGFFKVYDSIRDTVINLIQNIDEDAEANIYITGHSLGATTAALFALDIAYNNLYNKKNILMYNYASPRTGNKIFVKTYNKFVKKSIRFVNHNDLIPCLPPHVIFDNEYDHVYGQFLICFKPEKKKNFITECHEPENYYYTLLNIFDNDTSCNGNIPLTDLIICTPPLTYNADINDYIKRNPDIKLPDKMKLFLQKQK